VSHRRILNITWSEHVTNSEIRRCTGQPLLSDIVRARRLKLFGHVARVDKSQDHSRALRACIWHRSKNWKRRLGRPRHTWLRTVEADLRPFNLGIALGFKKAQDRTTWRALTGTATSWQASNEYPGPVDNNELKTEKITDVQFIQNQCKKQLKQTKVMLVSNYEFRLNTIVFIIHEWSMIIINPKWWK